VIDFKHAIQNFCAVTGNFMHPIARASAVTGTIRGTQFMHPIYLQRFCSHWKLRDWFCAPNTTKLQQSLKTVEQFCALTYWKSRQHGIASHGNLQNILRHIKHNHYEGFLSVVTWVRAPWMECKMRTNFCGIVGCPLQGDQEWPPRATASSF
jgi:hypothetical protein